MVITEFDFLSLISAMGAAFGGGWTAHKFLRKDKKSKKELKLIAEMIVKSGVFSNWNNVFEEKPELTKFMLEYPEIMKLVDNLTREKNDG